MHQPQTLGEARYAAGGTQTLPQWLAALAVITQHVYPAATIHPSCDGQDCNLDLTSTVSP